MSRDPSSHCFVSDMEARVSHYALNLAVDFPARILRGTCDYTCEPRGAGPCDCLVLDTRGLTVNGVVIVTKPDVETSTPYTLEPVVYPELGQALRIPLPPTTDTTVVRVQYHTDPSASGLQFMTPAQTRSGKHPYLFSQFQEIHARSMLPCQDTPSNKAPYNAEIAVPQPLVCVMSAVHEATMDLDKPPFEGATGQWSRFRWAQRVPICTYLIAVVVGELASKDISPRCRVWAEPEIVDAAAEEFAETEKYLTTAEALCGEYRWGRYDLLVLPPSFPYGGMENPCLTFVTPTLLTGDRSLTCVVAHEIAHSWAGNLVTNRSWECFWMNEGFTVFLERRILTAIFGERTVGLKMDAQWHALGDVVKQIGPEHNFTSLSPKLEGGADPDDAFSLVPYEKGFAFVCYLEKWAGGPTLFEPFLRNYFDTLAFGFTDPSIFRAMYTEAFPAAAEQVDWACWLTQPGMPPVRPTYNTSLVEEVKAMADQVASGADFDAAAFQDWTTDAHIMFLEHLNALAQSTPLPIPILDRLGTILRYDQTRNAELRYRFDLLGIRSRRESNIADALEFVTSQGRMKFTRPLFRALHGVDPERAHAVFMANEPRLHPICAKMVRRDLGL